MKKLITSITLAFFVSAFAAQAAGNNEVESTKHPLAVGIYQVKDLMKVNFALDKKIGEKAIVRFLDADGYTLYSNTVGKNESSYRFVFDLTKLPAGTYYVETTSNGKRITKKVVKTESITKEVLQNESLAIY